MILLNALSGLLCSLFLSSDEPWKVHIRSEFSGILVPETCAKAVAGLHNKNHRDRHIKVTCLSAADWSSQCRQVWHDTHGEAICGFRDIMDMCPSGLRVLIEEKITEEV